MSVLFIYSMSPESNNKKIADRVKDAIQKPMKAKKERMQLLAQRRWGASTNAASRPAVTAPQPPEPTLSGTMVGRVRVPNAALTTASPSAPDEAPSPIIVSPATKRQRADSVGANRRTSMRSAVGFQPSQTAPRASPSSQRRWPRIRV